MASSNLPILKYRRVAQMFRPRLSSHLPTRHLRGGYIGKVVLVGLLVAGVGGYLFSTSGS